MLIGYPPPALTGITITGAAWLTADGGAACCDGKPARKARANGTPTITLAYAQPFVPRIIAVLGLAGVEPGTAITATAADGTALGGNAATAQAVQLADGTIAAWIVTAGTVTVATGVKIAIAATGVIDIGELAPMPAVDVPIDKGWTQQRMDPSIRSSTRSSQLTTEARTSYRVLSCNFSQAPAGEAPVRFGGLANGMDWERLAAALAGGARCAVIPRWADAARIQATAQYGICSEIGATEHITGPFWRKAMVFQEVPAT